MTDTGELDAIREGLHHDDHEVREETLGPLYEGEYESDVVEELVDDLVPMLRDEPYVPQRAIGALRRADSFSDEQLDRLAALLTDDDWLVASRAVDVVYGIAKESKRPVDRVVPSLVSFLVIREGGTEVGADAEGPVVDHETESRRSFHHERRLKAIAILERVARDDPTALAPELEELVEIAGRPDRVDVRSRVLELLAIVAESEPDRFDGKIEAVSGLLDRSNALPVCSNAAYLLALIAEAHGEAVAEAAYPRRETLYEMLESKPGVQNAAIGLLAYVAEQRPDVVEPEKERILDLLEHPVESVRGNAVWTLSYAPDDEVLDRLETVAEEDPSEEIREHAAETAAALASER